MDNPRPCGPQPFANSNSGNGNLRPETLGAPRREKFTQPAKPTAETGSPREGYGNVALFLTLGNHVGLRGLGGGLLANALKRLVSEPQGGRLAVHAGDHRFVEFLHQDVAELGKVLRPSTRIGGLPFGKWLRFARLRARPVRGLSGCSSDTAAPSMLPRKASRKLRAGVDDNFHGEICSSTRPAS